METIGNIILIILGIIFVVPYTIAAFAALGSFFWKPNKNSYEDGTAKGCLKEIGIIILMAIVGLGAVTVILNILTIGCQSGV